ncbi:acyl-CoA dehydrogenase/oxidase C-terminal [Trichoderma afarasin]|uniref:Acyl-CoA dehydrogenase, middle domain-containing protein n=1 Tax=Trichoderma breve TaxID=2034170 RepID=A0A9W9JQ23_9HYPO|nr:acyl-CoA dehydrogenase, middle domain-containing protein [Trichoderma breve]KAJ4863758.1 acyl-CoA dehydrogenase, middle domain-containing protein [Trichoderma breve]
MEHSGANKGFFQPPPILPNQFYDDVSFQRCFKLFLPFSVITEVEAEVAALGRDVLSDEVFAWITDAERNKPYLKGSGRDAFGRWHGELVTGEGWRELQKFGLSRGIVATGYDTPYGAFSRPLQFLRLHLWEASSANVTCPSAMQDGAAALLRRHLASRRISEAERKVFEDAYRRLISRDPSVAWTSGQWMTERSGGSDVSQTETVATYQPEEAEGALASREGKIPLGPWSINGFKWFSSATDSNMTILLARTSQGGLSTFFAPMRRHDPTAKTMTGHPKANGSRLNGVWIQRLKNKLGTQSLPTAELVLEDMRGWKIGEEGKGIQEISTILTLTRIHNVVTACGYVGRGLGIARAYARRREVGAGRGARMKLTESTLHMRTLANLTAEYHGLMLLSNFCGYLLGISEHEATPPTSALAALTPADRLIDPLLRIVVPLAKAYVCKASVPLLYSCMESLGGVGYLVNEEQEYLNVARLYRDCCVLPIWEGTTDVLCTDMIRALKHPKTGAQSLDALENFIKTSYALKNETSVSKPPDWDPVAKWTAMRTYIDEKKQGDLVGEGREILWDIAEILISLLLFVDASTDGNEAAQEIFHRFVQDKFSREKRSRKTTAEELSRDLTIVYGVEEAEAVNREIIPKL